MVVPPFPFVVLEGRRQVSPRRNGIIATSNTVRNAASLRGRGLPQRGSL